MDPAQNMPSSATSNLPNPTQHPHPTHNQTTTKPRHKPTPTYAIRPATPTDLPYLPGIERSAAELFRSIPALACLADDEPTGIEGHEFRLRGWTGRGVGIGEGGIWVAVMRAGDKGGCSATGEGGEDEDDKREDGEEEVVGFIVTDLLSVIHDSAGHSARHLTDRIESQGLQHIMSEDGSKARSNEAADNDDDNDAAQAEALYLHIDELSIAKGHQRRGLAVELLKTVKTFAQDVVVSRDGTLTPHTVEAGDANSNSAIHARSEQTYAVSQRSPQRYNSGSTANTATIGGNNKTKLLGLSLTTFRDIPFNAPFYAKFGFRTFDENEVETLVGREGVRILKDDRARLGCLGERCFMVCEL